MSVEEIKKELVTLSKKEQSEITAFLFHLSHLYDEDYQKKIEERMADKDPAHWLTLQEFEARLDQRYTMAGYQVFLNFGLLDEVPKTGSQRKAILEFIVGLYSDPFQSGDFTDRDSADRIREIKVIGHHAIIYWVDAPAKTVMIVEISRTG